MTMRDGILYETLLDLHKAYDDPDRGRCPEIFAAYGMVTWTIRLLQRYWNQLTMFARAGSYFGSLFKDHNVVTKGDPLSPTIFKVVLDVFIWHWVDVVAATEETSDTRT